MFLEKIKTQSDLFRPDYREIMAARKNEWLAVAERHLPNLLTAVRQPRAMVRLVEDPSAFQGVRCEPGQALSAGWEIPLKTEQSFILDFGEHLVGQFGFSLGDQGVPVGFPVKLSFLFGEVPAEMVTPVEPLNHDICSSWVQLDTLTCDWVPGRYLLPRRYAFRYVKIMVEGVRGESVRFLGAEVQTVSAVDLARALPPPDGLDEQMAAIDGVSLRTLRDCMQRVFEDGPKRDRRLWLGDLRLEALTHAYSFRDYSLVKRCLYLFAGLPSPDGFIHACVYDQPFLREGDCRILDYCLLFSNTLLEYALASGDTKTAEDLFPVAARQFQNLFPMIDDEGLFQVPAKWWIFIDWHKTLHKQASLQGVILYALQSLRTLARLVGRPPQDLALLDEIARNLKQAANEKLYDASSGFFVSGEDRQVSWASQLWLILGGAIGPAEGKDLLLRVMAHPAAIKPVTPYLYHYLLEAFDLCGMREEAEELIRSYWGGMIAKGADTFWEVYLPEDDTWSPYGSYRLNSYCHAWSCTPAYFIRKRAGLGGTGEERVKKRANNHES